MEGFIQLHRKLLEWEWYDDVPTFKLFVHCLIKANYTTKQWRGYTILRGQFMTSTSNLSKESGLTTKQVRLSLEKLIKTGELGKATTSANTLITVVSYNDYQDRGKQKGKVGANEGQGRGKVGATTNKDNNNKKENKDNNKVPEKFNFKHSLIEFGFSENLVVDWMAVRKNKKATNTETAFKKFISEVEKTNKPPNEILEICISKDWKGFEKKWLDNLNNQSNGINQRNKETIGTHRIGTDWDEPM